MPVNYGYDYRYPQQQQQPNAPALNLPQPQGRVQPVGSRGATGNMAMPGQGGFVAPQYDQQSYYDMLIGAGADPATAYQWAAGRYGGQNPAQVMQGIMNSGYAGDYLAKMGNITALAAARPNTVGMPVATGSFDGGQVVPVGTGGQVFNNAPQFAPTYDPVAPAPPQIAWGQGAPAKQYQQPAVNAHPGGIAQQGIQNNAPQNAIAAPTSPQPNQAMGQAAPPLQNGFLQLLMNDPNTRAAIIQSLLMQG